MPAMLEQCLAGLASRRPCIRAVAVLAALACGPLDARPSAAAAPDGAAVLKAVADLTDWLRASGAGSLETAAPPEVVERAGTQVVRMPGLVWRTPDAAISLGDVEVARSDAGAGLWRLVGALPARVTVESPGAPAMVVSVRTSSVDVVVDPGTGTVSHSAIDASDLEADVETIGRAVIARLAIGSDVRDGPGGKAILTSGYRLDGLVVTAAPAAPGGSPVELLRLASIATEARLDGVDWPRLLELQAFAVANQAELSAGDGGELGQRLQALATSPELIADGFAFSFGVEDVRIGEEAGGPVSVARLDFRLGVAGLAGASAAGSIGYGHDGLKVGAALPVDAAAVPESFALEIGVERIPGRQLLELLGMGIVEEAPLVALLQQAGTTARVSGARIRMDGMGADLDAEVRSSASAPDGVAGKLDLVVVNLDRIVAALGPMITDELAAIQFASVLGQRAEAADGTVTHRWALERDDSGRSTLNGNDISALVGDGMAGIGRTLGGGQQEEAAPATDEIAALPEAGAGLTAALLAARLEEFGLGATASTDDSGEPTVSADLADALEGYTLHVQFFDCAEDGVCDSCMLYLGIEPDKQVPFAKLNEWNSGERWVRAYRGENRAVWLELDVAGESGIDVAIGRFLEAAERFVAAMVPER